MDEWKCQTPGCPATVYDLLLFEPMVLEQYITPEGEIEVSASYPSEGEFSYFVCGRCDRQVDTDNVGELIGASVVAAVGRKAELRRERLRAAAKRRATNARKANDQYEAETGLRRPTQ